MTKFSKMSVDILEDRLRPWNIPDFPIRFKKKALKPTGLNNNGQEHNIKKTLLTFEDWEIEEDVNMVKDARSEWKKKNEKTYYIMKGPGTRRTNTYYSLAAMKDVIQYYLKKQVIDKEKTK